MSELENKSAFEKRIGLAIFDPGAIVGYRDWENDEPLSHWQWRAVMAVIDEQGQTDEYDNRR